MSPLRMTLAGCFAAAALAAPAPAWADVEVVKSGATVTVTGEVFQDRLSLGSGSGFSITVFEEEGDRVDAGAGCTQLSDSLVGCTGITNAVLNLNGGNDFVNNSGTGTPANLTFTTQVNGGGGDDTLGPLTSDDALNGGEGHDTLTLGTAGAASATTEQVANGDDGDDDIAGGPGPDLIDGGDGADDVDGGAGADDIHGGIGDDTLDGGADIDQLRGGFGNDTITGDHLAERLKGGNGGDTFAGDGTVDYSDHAAEVTVSIGSGAGNDGNSSDGEPGSRDTVPVGLAVSGTSDATGDTITAAGGSAIISGSGGPDDITGSPFNDTLNGGDGDDVIHAGDGPTDGVFGGAGADELHGGLGDDSLNGGADADELFGEAGDDGLTGGPGPDSLHGGGDVDIVRYDDHAAGVEVTLDTGTNADNDGNAEDGALGARDDVDAVSVEDILGSPHDDVLTGDDGANQMYGRSGRDAFHGQGGPDVLHASPGGGGFDGGPGADTFLGTSGSLDIADYTSSTADVTVDLTDAPGNEGAAGEGDTLLNIDHVIAGPGDDTVTVDGASVDLVDGRNGDDTVRGARRLRGGDGNDRLLPGPLTEDANGNADVDTVSYAHATGPVTVDFTGPLPDGVAGEPVLLLSIEAAEGSPAADTLTGDLNTRALSGGGGDDVITAGTRAATLTGGGDDDTLVGGPLPDAIAAGDGDDEVDVREGDVDDVACGAGADAYRADAGADAVAGDCETDLLAPPPPDPGGTDTGGGSGGDTTGSGGDDTSAPPPPAAPAPPPAPAPATASLASPDGVAPRLSALRLTRRGRRATLRFTLSEPGSVRLVLERRARGRFRRAGATTQQGKAGANSMRLPASLARRLRPGGGFRLVVVATDAGGNRSAATRVAVR